MVHLGKQEIFDFFVGGGGEVGPEPQRASDL